MLSTIRLPLGVKILGVQTSLCAVARSSPISVIIPRLSEERGEDSCIGLLGGNDAPRCLSSKPCLANRERADAQARRPFAALNSNRRTDEKSERKPSHIRIIRAAAALRRHPIDVLRRVLDVARLAVDAILRVDHEPRVRLQLLIAIDHLKDAGGAIEPRRLAIVRQVSPNRNRRILQVQMAGLVFLMIGVGNINRGEPVESELAIRLRVVNGRHLAERFQARMIGSAMA